MIVEKKHLLGLLIDSEMNEVITKILESKKIIPPESSGLYLRNSELVLLSRNLETAMNKEFPSLATSKISAIIDRLLSVDELTRFVSSNTDKIYYRIYRRKKPARLKVKTAYSGEEYISIGYENKEEILYDLISLLKWSTFYTYSTNTFCMRKYELIKELDRLILMKESSELSSLLNKHFGGEYSENGKLSLKRLIEKVIELKNEVERFVSLDDLTLVAITPPPYNNRVIYHVLPILEE